jgi:hypothetical protein
MRQGVSVFPPRMRAAVSDITNLTIWGIFMWKCSSIFVTGQSLHFRLDDSFIHSLPGYLLLKSTVLLSLLSFNRYGTDVTAIKIYILHPTPLDGERSHTITFLVVWVLPTNEEAFFDSRSQSATTNEID